MGGSVFGNSFKITTWGESHGKAVGVVIDGVPAGLSLCEEDIQVFLDRRKPGQSKFTTARKEGDLCEILSGVFEGKTTGTPISVMVKNEDQHSKDYSAIQDIYRPGHADYGFNEKFGFRDHRGGGRSSGRETIGRVAAGAVAIKILKELGIDVITYAKAIGPVEVREDQMDLSEITENPFCLPSKSAASEAETYVETCISEKDSAGGVVECRVKGMPAGIGEPVFDKLDATLARAVMSIGAVKGVEIGDGFAASKAKGSENNDAFAMDGNRVIKKTNHAGGILGGISDGADILLRAAVKPTPSIAQPQNTVTTEGTETLIEIHGRHDPIIVPRAVVVIESMVAITLCDALFSNMSARMDHIKKIYGTDAR
ncbi:MAG: chorismate synthase [Lachnospiraceae bacterium]|nr:chorismate synthase [Lachnospiraceae bacterium]